MTPVGWSASAGKPSSVKNERIDCVAVNLGLGSGEVPPALAE
ncbi:MAG: hypothetical protein R3E03_05010 [Novosphingobium sp.]